MILYGVNISNKKEVIKWLNKIRKGSGDARPLWIAMSKKMPEFTDYEFDPNADPHKLWPGLTKPYLKWKKRKFGHSGMGFLHGNLQKAAGIKAKRMITPKTMLWMVNPNITGAKGKKVGDYLYRFHYGFTGSDSLGRNINQPARRIFRYTALRVNSFLKLDAKKFKSGAVHASFTYNWLRKVLEVK